MPLPVIRSRDGGLHRRENGVHIALLGENVVGIASDIKMFIDWFRIK